eukprot:RCo041528
MSFGNPGDEAVEFSSLTKQLSDLLKEKSPNAKKVVGFLEELTAPSFLPYFRPEGNDLVPALLRLLKCEEDRVQGLCTFLLSVILRARPTPEFRTRLSRECKIAESEHLRSQTLTLKVLLDTLSLCGRRREMEVPTAVITLADKFLKLYGPLKKEKKKTLSIKTAKHEQEKRDRAYHHMALLRFFRVCFLEGASCRGNTVPVITCAVEYSQKPKDYNIPLIREALGILVLCVEHHAGIPLTAVEKCLPLSQAQIIHTAQEKKRKDKEDKKKEKKDGEAVFPTHEPFTTVNLVKLCIAVVASSRRQADVPGEVAASSPAAQRFATSLKHLLHHQSPFVFSEAVLGMLQHNLFAVLLEGDIVYAKSSDTILDYVINRTTTFLSSTSQLDVHAGLRLTAAVAEHTTR